MRRRNPSRRSRLTPAEEGELGARKDAITNFVKFARNSILHGEPIAAIVFEGRQWEMSWASIRKGLRSAMNEVVVLLQRKMK